MKCPKCQNFATAIYSIDYNDMAGYVVVGCNVCYNTPNFVSLPMPKPIDPERLELTKAALTGLLACGQQYRFQHITAVEIADATLAELRKPKDQA